jgi:hypothetical protein
LHHWHGPEGCDWRCSSSGRPLIGPMSKARTKRIPRAKEIIRREGPSAQPNTPRVEVMFGHHSIWRDIYCTRHRRSSCGVHCLTQSRKRLGENGEGVSETGTCTMIELQDSHRRGRQLTKSREAATVGLESGKMRGARLTKSCVVSRRARSDSPPQRALYPFCF